MEPPICHVYPSLICLPSDEFRSASGVGMDVRLAEAGLK